MARFYIAGVLTIDDDIEAEEVADIIIDAAESRGLSFAGGVRECPYADTCKDCAAAEGCFGYVGK